MGGSAKTQTTSSAPWQPAQAGLKSVLGRADRLGRKTNLFKPVQGADTRASLGQLGDIGREGSFATQPIQNVVDGSTGAGFQSGQGALQGTSNGDYLNGNPYLNDVLDYASNDAQDRINQNFSAAGRYGSGAHNEVLARELGNIQTTARFQNYNNERDRQLNSAGQLYSGGFSGASLAPQLDQSRLFGSSVLGQAGAQQDQFDLANKQAPLRGAEWQAGLTAPIAALGNTQSQTQEQGSNLFGQILGGGMMAGGLLTGNPMMAMGGASNLFGSSGGGGGGIKGPGLVSSFGNLAGSF